MPIVFRLLGYERPDSQQVVCFVSNGNAEKRIAGVLAVTYPELVASHHGTGFRMNPLCIEETYKLAGSIPESLEAFFGLGGQFLWVIDETDLSICLDFYQLPQVDDDGAEAWKNTEVGGLVFHSKYRHWTAGATAAAVQLGLRIKTLVESHPTLSAATHVVAIPPSSTHGKRADLASTWSKRLVAECGLTEVVLRRSRLVQSQKDFDGSEARRKNQMDSMVCDQDISGARVIVVDDLYTSGETMNEATRALKVAGASRVYGICAVKTAKGTQGHQF